MAEAAQKAGSETSPQSSSVRAVGNWLYTPALDLIVGCGAWSAPLLLLTYALTQASTFNLAIIFYLLALVFNYPHYMATIYRAYGTREDFSKYRVFTVHLTALLVLTAIFAHLSFKLLPWIFTLYIAWSPWHYSGQNYGLLMMFARRNGAEPTQTERRALYAAFLVSYLMLLISFNTGMSHDALVLSLGIPQRVSAISRAIGGVLFAALAGFGLYRLIRQTGVRAMLAPLTLFSTQTLWFVLPTVLEISYDFRLPQTRYSTGILAVMHSAQYLWVTSYYARREALALEQRDAGWSLWKYFGTLTAGGIALFIPGPWLVSYIFRYDITVSFLIFTALVNIHHFILDGAIWKLRDGRIAALLLNTRSRLSGENQESVLGGATRWLRGSTSGARALRIAVMLVLFLWAGVEEVRYYFGFNGSDVSNLVRATRLDPYDAGVHMRIAVAQAGDWQAAVAALRQAAAVSPHQPAPQAELARILIEHGRYEEAYAQYGQMVEQFPADSLALTNYGIVASQLGHSEEALASWQRALEADPGRIELHLLIANAFEKQSSPQLEQAAIHYEEYVRQLLANPEKRPEPKVLISALLRFANLNTQLHRPDLALANYQSAAAIAQNVHEAALESQAHAGAAELEEAKGQPAAAARSYQRAIALDAASGDVRNEARDWFNYGQFLRRRHLTRLAYACLLKSEDLLRSDTSSPEMGMATTQRKQVETQLGKESSVVRRDLPGILARATALEQKDFSAEAGN